MPTSLLSIAPYVVSLVESCPERKVLEVGPGHGKYGLLLREYLNRKPTRLVAVEAHRPYLEEWGGRLAAVYDDVFLANGLDLVGPVAAEVVEPFFESDGSPRARSRLVSIDLEADFLDGFDLLLLVDVIEHFPKDRALALLDRFPGRVVICTPRDFFVSVKGHPTEEHVSHWTREDFEATGRLEHFEEQYAGLLVRLSPKA